MPDLTIIHDTDDHGTTWLVIDQDGNVVRSFDTLHDAEQYVIEEGE